MTDADLAEIKRRAVSVFYQDDPGAIYLDFGKLLAEVDTLRAAQVLRRYGWEHGRNAGLEEAALAAGNSDPPQRPQDIATTIRALISVRDGFVIAPYPPREPASGEEAGPSQQRPD